MSPAVEVIDQAGVCGSDRPLRELAEAVLQAEGATGGLVIVLVDEPAITELNRRYRGVEECTDVLSFREADAPAWQDAAPVAGDAGDDLGEVLVCPAVVCRYAREDERPENLQLGWTLVHGVLHLLGYDHEVDRGEMRRREEELLAAFAPLVAALPTLASDEEPW